MLTALGEQHADMATYDPFRPMGTKPVLILLGMPCMLTKSGMPEVSGQIVVEFILRLRVESDTN